MDRLRFSFNELTDGRLVGGLGAVLFVGLNPDILGTAVGPIGCVLGRLRR